MAFTFTHKTNGRKFDYPSMFFFFLHVFNYTVHNESRGAKVNYYGSLPPFSERNTRNFCKINRFDLIKMRKTFSSGNITDYGLFFITLFLNIVSKL